MDDFNSSLHKHHKSFIIIPMWVEFAGKKRSYTQNTTIRNKAGLTISELPWPIRPFISQNNFYLINRQNTTNCRRIYKNLCTYLSPKFQTKLIYEMTVLTLNLHCLISHIHVICHCLNPKTATLHRKSENIHK